MMHIEKFECNMFQENCYIASDETKECVIIDCGAFYEEERKAIVNYIRSNNLTPKHLIATHAHIDHNFGNDTILDNFGLKPEVSAKDEAMMGEFAAQARSFAGLEYNAEAIPVGKAFDDSYTVEFGTHKLRVIPTPGHTPGSVMFYCGEEHVVFSGDTLFRMSIGRTDLPCGSFSDIIQSLQTVVRELPADTVVLPGHSVKTTIGFEQQYNPYIK